MNRILLLALVFAALAAPLCANDFLVGTWESDFLREVGSPISIRIRFLYRFYPDGAGKEVWGPGTTEQPILWRFAAPTIVITRSGGGSSMYTLYRYERWLRAEEGYYIAVGSSGSPRLWHKLSDDPDYPVD